MSNFCLQEEQINRLPRYSPLPTSLLHPLQNISFNTLDKDKKVALFRALRNDYIWATIIQTMDKEEIELKRLKIEQEKANALYAISIALESIALELKGVGYEIARHK